MMDYIRSYDTFHESPETVIELECKTEKAENLCHGLNTCIENLQDVLKKFKCVNKVLDSYHQVVQYHSDDVKVQFTVDADECYVECIVVHTQCEPGYDSLCYRAESGTMRDMQRFARLALCGTKTQVKDLYNVHGRKSDNIEALDYKDINRSTDEPGLFRSSAPPVKTAQDSISYFSNIFSQNQITPE